MLDTGDVDVLVSLGTARGCTTLKWLSMCYPYYLL